MIAPAIAEHDRLDQCGPAEIVDVIERRARRDQHAHHLGVAEMRGGDQRRALIGAGDVLRIAAAGERELEHRHIVGHRHDGDDVVLLRVERVRVGAAADERLRGRLVAEVRRDMQRRAAMAVDCVDLLAGRDQPRDLGGIALGGSRVQAAIGGDLRRAGRDLRGGGQGEQQGRDQKQEAHPRILKEKSPGGLGRGKVFGVTWGGEWASLPGGERLSPLNRFTCGPPTRPERSGPSRIRCACRGCKNGRGKARTAAGRRGGPPYRGGRPCRTWSGLPYRASRPRPD